MVDFFDAPGQVADWISDTGAGIAEGFWSGESPIGTAIVKTVSDPLRIRSGPGLSYDVIGSLPKDASVPYYDDNGGWLEINFGGTPGYISKALTDIGGATGQPKSTASTTPTSTRFGSTTPTTPGTTSTSKTAKKKDNSLLILGGLAVVGGAGYLGYKYLV